MVDARIKRYPGEVSAKRGLIIIERAVPPRDKRGQALWKVRCCWCGKIKVILGHHFHKARSCGCLKIKHGEARKHGRTTPEYHAWEHMKLRCCNSNHHKYPRYGGRGIKVCKEWLHNFSAFLECVGRRPGPEYSLDRIDNDGDYAPGNVRWATRKQQQRNSSIVQLLTFQNQTLSVPEWAERLGISINGLKNRLSRGWSIEKALTQPVQKRKK